MSKNNQTSCALIIIIGLLKSARNEQQEKEGGELLALKIRKIVIIKYTNKMKTQQQKMFLLLFSPSS